MYSDNIVFVVLFLPADNRFCLGLTPTHPDTFLPGYLPHIRVRTGRGTGMQLALTDIDPSTDTNQGENNTIRPIIAGYKPATDTDDDRETTLNEYIHDNWDNWEIHPVMTAEQDTPRDLLADIETNAAEIDHVIVAHLTDISQSWRDIRDVVAQLTDHEATVHAVTDGITISNGDDALRLLDLVGATEADQAAERELRPDELVSEPHIGRPPAGFTVEDGRLVPGEDYDRVRAAIRAADRGQLSKSKAADEAGCTRRTVTRAIEQRRDLYNLDDGGDVG